MREIKQLATELEESLYERPHEWDWLGEHRYRIGHTSGVEVWITSLEFEMHKPHKMKFPWAEHFRLRRAFKHWRRVRGKHTASEADRSGALKALAMLRGVPLRQAA